MLDDVPHLTLGFAIKQPGFVFNWPAILLRQPGFVLKQMDWSYELLEVVLNSLDESSIALIYPKMA